MDDSKRSPKFSRRVYLVFLTFLAIALLQWLVITMIPTCRDLFRKYEVYCSIAFVLAVLLFCVFLFVSNIRSHNILKWLIAAAIVELYIFSMFFLVARSWWPDMLAYYCICFVAMMVFLVIGCNLTFSMDMTENIAPIFIASFIMASTSMYPLMMFLFVAANIPYLFMAFELILTAVMLLLVMLHAQTIGGDRFIQMSTNDFLLAALLLFHEFLAMYAMTFYWQINNAFFTPKDFFWMSTSTPSSTMDTTEMEIDLVPQDDIKPGSEWDLYDYDKKPSF